MKKNIESAQEIFCYVAVGGLVLFLVRADKSPHFFLGTMSTILKKILFSYIIKHSTDVVTKVFV